MNIAHEFICIEYICRGWERGGGYGSHFTTKKKAVSQFTCLKKAISHFTKN